MLYELIAIVRAGRLSEAREIARAAGGVILQRNGVIRGITNWGTFLLPSPLRKHTIRHDTGHYFIMRFDSSAKVQHAVRRTLGMEPRLLRYSIVRMGKTLEDIKDVSGEAEWAGEQNKIARRRGAETL